MTANSHHKMKVCVPVKSIESIEETCSCKELQHLEKAENSMVVYCCKNCWGKIFKLRIEKKTAHKSWNNKKRAK